MSSLPSKEFQVQSADLSDVVSLTAKRVAINADVLKTYKVYAGDVIALANAQNIKSAYAVGIAWPSTELPLDAVQVSRSLLLTSRVEEGDRVHVHPLSSSKSQNNLPSLRQIQEAGAVHLKEIVSVEDGHQAIRVASSEKGKRRDWLTLLLRETLISLKYINSAQIVEIVYEGRSRRFEVISVRPGREQESTHPDISESLHSLSLEVSPRLWTIGWNSVVSVVDQEVIPRPDASYMPEVESLENVPEPTAYSTVGGLDKQIAQIRDLLEIPLTRPDLFRYFGLKPPRGILLHGPPGTGKTHLARAIASSTYSSVLIVNGPELSSAYHGETESKLRAVFKEAREKSPCIVVLDEVDALVPRREDGAGAEVEKRVVATLLTILDGMEEGQGDQGRVVVIGTTNRPNAIDPALRRPGRFDREIEIGIPDAAARLSILDVLLHKTPHAIPQEDLYAVAARAHGYVGADLSAVVREAGTIAIKRWLAENPSTSISDPSSRAAKPTLTLSDLLTSLPFVRPSAMRSVFLETPPVLYSDIGGQDSVIQKLREAVEWPLLHPDAFDRLGVKPPKGVLLYGPPGCSKTILVRACAYESGINFIAVKGPELLNKFVGESERAVREIFRKARAASPSIIFFDEIDALATSRSSADSAASHEGVLTSLLNEMDGVQELVGVTVVAATNRPDIIDSALMRPGRLDRILYVGPPDQKGRVEILRIRMRKMSISSDVDVEEIARMTDGCSGAEITALCQEAAMLTMRQDMNASHVPYSAFVAAAKSLKRQITAGVVADFKRWQDASGIRLI